MKKAIYGILISSLLFYRIFFGYLENILFYLNLYNPIVTNRIKVDKQHKLRFRMENIVYIHVNTKVNDKFKECMNCNYGKSWLSEGQ